MKLLILSAFAISIVFMPQNLLSQNNWVTRLNSHTSTNFSVNSVSPNAESLSFGEIGVVSKPDIYTAGVFDNPALLIRNKQISGAHFSYMPLLRNLIGDNNFYNGSFFYALNEKNVLAYNINFLKLSSIYFVPPPGQLAQSYFAKEHSNNIKYAHSFNDFLSVGVGGKYTVSDKAWYDISGERMKLSTFSFDWGSEYRNRFMINKDRAIDYSFGLSVLDLGPKVKYISSSEEMFQPTKMLLGTLWTFCTKSQKENLIGFSLGYQLEKFLIPSAYLSQAENETLPSEIANVSAFQGLTYSFDDSLDGIKGELSEVYHKLGIDFSKEVSPTFSYSLRAGLVHNTSEGSLKKYRTVGFVLKIKSIYFATAGILAYRNNPYYANTLSFTIGGNF